MDLDSKKSVGERLFQSLSVLAGMKYSLVSCRIELRSINDRRNTTAHRMGLHRIWV